MGFLSEESFSKSDDSFDWEDFHTSAIRPIDTLIRSIEDNAENTQKVFDLCGAARVFMADVHRIFEKQVPGILGGLYSEDD